MRELEQFQLDEIVDLLREFHFRSRQEPDLQDEIQSILDLLGEKDEDE